MANILNAVLAEISAGVVILWILGILLVVAVLAVIVYFIVYRYAIEHLPPQESDVVKVVIFIACLWFPLAMVCLAQCYKYGWSDTVKLLLPVTVVIFPVLGLIP